MKVNNFFTKYSKLSHRNAKKEVDSSLGVCFPVFFLGRCRGRKNEFSIYAEVIPYAKHVALPGAIQNTALIKAYITTISQQRVALAISKDLYTTSLLIRGICQHFGTITVALLDYRLVSEDSVDIAMHWPLTVAKERYKSMGIVETTKYLQDFIDEQFGILETVW